MKNGLYLLISVVLVFVISSVLIFKQETPGVGDDKEQYSVHNTSNDIITLSVMNTSGQVDWMPIDDYLTAVLLREMPTSFSLEALKAQAIVARTYGLRRLEKNKHDNSAVCTDANCCQGFRTETDFLKSGGSMEALEKVKSAVEDTRNIVLTYQGLLIDATYFSCSGGMTEDAVAVWGKDVPYLQATESPGEEAATHYMDEVRYDEGELAGRLSIKTDAPPETWVESISFTSGGGVNDITICGKVFSGVTMRKLLNLPSTAFSIQFQGSEFIIKTKGYGHRVGMSQYGAEAMALNGASYEEILKHYYTGVTLSQYAAED